MPRRPSARRSAPTLSPRGPVLLAVAGLGVLAFARWRLDAHTPAPATLDAGSYLTTIAPMLRAAGCATGDCHSGRTTPYIATTPGAARELQAEFDAVRASAHPGDGRRSLLWRRAVDPSHAGVGALDRDGCAARTLARWIDGAAVRPCPPSPL